MEKIGLVAGSKNLPFEIVSWAKQKNKELFVVGIFGCVDSKLKEKLPSNHFMELPIYKLSKTIAFFKSNNVKKILILGGVHNASIKISFDVIKIFSKLLFVKNKYDGILRLIIKEFEKNGIKVIGIDEILPDCVVESGVITKIRPTEQEMKDITSNIKNAKDFVNTDKGQALVIFKGKVIAVEDFKGTDNLIKRAYSIKGNKSGGVLLKLLKPKQERRVDIPVIGPNTIHELVSGKFRGIAIDANNAIFENKKEVLKLANNNNIFIIGYKF